MDRTAVLGAAQFLDVSGVKEYCPNFGKVHQYEFRGESILDEVNYLIQSCECGKIKVTSLKELVNASKT